MATHTYSPASFFCLPAFLTAGYPYGSPILQGSNLQDFLL